MRLSWPKFEPKLKHHYTAWREWFAWYPVLAKGDLGGPEKLVWLETVFTRGGWTPELYFHPYDYEYDEEP